jgi:hypothetical protein
MKKRLSLFAPLLASALALAAACDPDLTPAKAGDGGAEGGPTSSGSSGSSGTPTDAGDGDATSDAPSDAGGDDAGTTHAIDGNNDFAAADRLDTSSSVPKPYYAYVSWDASKVYFGMSGDDIGPTATDKKWVLIYVDGNPGNAGTDLGIAYNGGGAASTPQQAKLPFAAGFHFRWKTGGDKYNDLQKWSGSAWTKVALTVDLKQKNDFVELAIPRSVLGSPKKLKVVMLMSIEDPGNEWTYAVAPKNGWTDGRFPAPQQIPKYYELDLDDTKPASQYAPLP